MFQAAQALIGYFVGEPSQCALIRRCHRSIVNGEPNKCHDAHRRMRQKMNNGLFWADIPTTEEIIWMMFYIDHMSTSARGTYKLNKKEGPKVRDFLKKIKRNHQTPRDYLHSMCPPPEKKHPCKWKKWDTSLVIGLISAAADHKSRASSKNPTDGIAYLTDASVPCDFLKPLKPLTPYSSLVLPIVFGILEYAQIVIGEFDKRATIETAVELVKYKFKLGSWGGPISTSLSRPCAVYFQRLLETFSTIFNVLTIPLAVYSQGYTIATENVVLATIYALDAMFNLNKAPEVIEANDWIKGKMKEVMAATRRKSNENTKAATLG